MKSNTFIPAAIMAFAAFFIVVQAATGETPAEIAAQTKSQDVSWNSPSLASKDSMPIGNGDIGINVWNDSNGDLMLYIGKTDAFDESCNLLKLGRLRLHFSDNPFASGQPFHQELDLINGEIRITGGSGAKAVTVRLWVDANHPVIHVETESATPLDQSASVEIWRTEKKPLHGDWPPAQRGQYALHREADANPDTVVSTAKIPGLKNQLIWYHRNEVSIFQPTLKLQGIDPAECAPDPLLGRTFGCAVMADGWTPKSTTTLQTTCPASRSDLEICVLTEQTPDIGTWLNDMKMLEVKIGKLSLEQCRAAHRQWWAQFWSRSWVCVSGSNAKDTADITRGWYLNRFVTACTARGDAPVKFNGAIFNVDGIDAYASLAPGNNADSRMWGAGFWFQNERHIYWPMIEAGDYEQLLPFFKMYRDALPLAMARTRAYYGHGGAFFPETMYLWGTYINNADFGYGFDRTGKPPGLTDNGYVRRYWQGGIEVSAMMLEHYRHTQDKAFARKTLVPIAEQIVVFYDQHYKRDAEGKIHFAPAQMLETMWNVENPMPEIAGLHCILSGLLDLPADVTSDVQRAEWKRILAELPPLPMTKIKGISILANAGLIFPGTRNSENGNLYAVWPYKLLGVAVGNLKLAQDSYAYRWHKGGPYQCWNTDILFAAYCGLANEATDHLAYRFVHSNGLRFPTFYAPGDWVPDIDNGGVCQNTIQSMLMQTSGSKIVLLPAWPKQWNASFKLHAPENTTVEGRVENGKFVQLLVTPESRRKDVQIR